MASLRDRVKTKNTGVSAPENADRFIKAAENTPMEQVEYPWEEFDKKAVPRTTFNLRLNDYELGLLRSLAERRGDSMQKVAKRALIPLLEKMAVEEAIEAMQT